MSAAGRAAAFGLVAAGLLAAWIAARSARTRIPAAPEPERALPELVKHESAAGEPQDPPDDLEEKSFHLDI